MIDCIKYTIDGISYIINKDQVGNWSSNPSAPSVEGRKDIPIEAGVSSAELTPVRATDPHYNEYLNIIKQSEIANHIENYVPEFISQLEQFKLLYGIENLKFNDFDNGVRKVLNDSFINTSSEGAVLRYENFLNLKGVGTLEQRKSYIISLIQKGNKLDEQSIKSLVHTITGSDCKVRFFLEQEEGSPNKSQNLLLVTVLSPDSSKDYRYEDIERALQPLIPAHINLSVVKYFATWGDIANNVTDWQEVKDMGTWDGVYHYTPPEMAQERKE